MSQCVAGIELKTPTARRVNSDKIGIGGIGSTYRKCIPGMGVRVPNIRALQYQDAE